MSEPDNQALNHAQHAMHLMHSQGFQCVFEHKMPSDHRGATYYTHWINLTTGSAGFTIAGPGGYQSFRLVPADGAAANDDRYELLLPEYEYCLEQIKEGEPQFAISRLEMLIANIKKEKPTGVPAADNVVPIHRCEVPSSE